MAMTSCRECGNSNTQNKTLTAQVNKLYNGKSIAVYLVLCWFLGVFGAHRFYAHKTGSAVVMLILSLTVVGLLITTVWSLIDFIIGLCNVSTPANVFQSK